MIKKIAPDNWESWTVNPAKVIEKIKPGMSIFLGTAVAEPRTMVRYLMNSDAKNLEDLELIQLVSVGDAVSLQTLHSQNFRLKTFFHGWVADEAIKEGRVDLIPSRFVKIPQLIESLLRPVDAAIVQITTPNEAGFCSLGIAVDVAREALDQASIRVGEINTQIPRTFGDTFVEAAEFDFLIRATEPPIYFDRWTISDVWDRVAEHVASLIEDGSCLAFSIGPLYEALAKRLANKRHLGIHSPIFTDPLMDLMQCGAATNRRKETYRGKALTSYAFGTKELMAWLDNNPLVEFQRISRVFNPLTIGSNPRFVTVVAARKVDLYGRIGLYIGKGNVASGPAEVMDFLSGAELSEDGRSIFALTSRDPGGSPNILLSIADLPNQFGAIESVGAVVTEYGIAFLEGRTLRERAQALVDIAHPDDRAALVQAAKDNKILYRDQIFLADSARLYPADIAAIQTIKEDLGIRYRAIRPSDEEGMRTLFYRFSDEAVYSRYFHSISSMPHSKMQEYVNVDWNQIVSIVGLVGEEGQGRIIAEARFIRIPGSSLAEVVFVVDEQYQRLGIASFMYKMLIRLARERGIGGFTAEVLFSNLAIMKVFRKGDLPVKAHLESGVYHLEIPFNRQNQS
ncbi:MAG: GNAT family N-acetyltransferase [Deltaproteobacteria bacterium]|jgi:acyl-CoA hydrolase/GNAT superfamily N-acetyltransferase|nr:GNAT family N-acetyltransferase [Deltaproteobacteria bacterium]